MTVSGLADVFRRRLPQIVATTALAVGAAALYLLLVPATYTSHAVVYITPHALRAPGDGASAPAHAGADLAIVDSQVAIIGSSAMLKRVVATLSLDEDREFGAPHPLVAWTQALGRTQAIPPQDLAATRLAQRLEILRSANTYIIHVAARANSPAKAAQITDTLVSLYLADQTAARSEEERRASALISGRLGALRDQVRQAEDRVDDFKRRNRITVSEGSVVDEQHLGKLNGELAAARAAAAAAKARLDAAHNAAADMTLDALPEAVRSPTIQRLREQLVQVARSEASLSGQLKPRHPGLIEVRSELAEVRAQIKAELRRIIGGLAIEHETASNRATELERATDASKAEVERMATAQIKLRELEQDVVASRAVLAEFLHRAKQAHEREQIAVPFARVVSPATTPVAPSGPDKGLLLAVAALAGLGFGALRAAAAAAFDTSVRMPAERAPAGQPVTLLLPDLAHADDRSGLLARAPLRAPDPGRALLAVCEPQGARDAAYRQGLLRLLSLIERDRHDDYPSAVMIVGAGAEAGGSAVALALTETATRAGARVLLVDASSVTASLSTLLQDDTASDAEPAHWPALLAKPEALAEHTQRAEDGALSFLPLARADLRRLKRVERRQLAANLAVAALDYDLVVIDGGALAVDESASALFPLTDKIVVAARQGATRQHELDDLLRLVAAGEGHVAALLLTGATPRLS